MRKNISYEGYRTLPPLGSDVSQFNPVHSFAKYMSVLILFFNVRLRLQHVTSFLAKILYIFLSLAICATRSGHLSRFSLTI